MKKRSRLLSALLALVMVVGMVPALGTTALAAEQEEITQVDLAVDPPEAGKTPGAAEVVGDADQYEIWNNWDPPVNVFEAGGTYTVEVHLTARNGVFSQNVKATMNGQAATVVEGAGTENLTVSYTFPALATEQQRDIPSVSVTGIEPPAIGTVPDGTAVAASRDYTVAAVNWEPADKTFLAGKEYGVILNLEAVDGKKFSPNVTATVNGQTARVISGAGTQEMTISYTFPALSEQEPEDIEVVAIIGIDVPVLGATPDRTAEAESKHHIVTNVQWTPGDSKFAAGKKYTVNVTVKGDGDYRFPSWSKVKATVNGEPATIVSGTGTSVIRVHYTFPALEGEPEPLPFGDVPEDKWYYESVRGAYELGLINGKTAGDYAPDDSLTFAEAVKLAACMHQLYTEGEVTLSNGSGQWYTSYYDYCRDNDIIPAEETDQQPGYDELIAQANEKITRREYALLFSAALPDEALPEKNTIPDDSIPDVKSTSSVYDQAIYKLYRAGIVSGSDAKGTFRPDDTIRRSEVAAILIRMMDPSMRVGAPAELGT